MRTMNGHSLSEIEIGMGNWAWGDRFFWGNSAQYGVAEARAAFEQAVARGVTFVDTAEVYNFGYSERLLGQFIRETGQRVTIATKFMPYPWRFSKRNLLRALRSSLERLGVDQVALYQIHWPSSPVAIERWMDALADAVELGLTRAVGVSNFNVAQLRRAHEALARRGVPLASNQIEYSLVARGPESSGLLDACRELGVTVIAYSPLGQGLLTGKYTPQSPPPGVRGRALRRKLPGAQPLVGLLNEIGQAHADDNGPKTPAQVALNWTICNDTLPIPGARNARQAAQNAGAAGWRLAEDEIAALDRASQQV